MIHYLECFYKDQPMGAMSWNPHRNQGWFEFEPSFWKSDIRFSPIRFPDDIRGSKSPVLYFGGTNSLPPFFEDALPGPFARTLLEYALQPSGKSTRNLSPLAWCSLLGKRGLGAFRFSPSGYPEFDADVSWDGIPKKGMASLKNKNLKDALRCGLFTPFDHASFFLAINSFTGEVRSGQANIPQGFEAWVMYPDGFDSPLKHWYTYHEQAKAAGFNVLPCRLMHEKNHTHLLSKRLDRQGSEIVHIQSYKALREPYGPEAADSCEGLFRCMRMLRLPYNEHVEWYRRIVFNGMASNRQERASDVLFTYTNKQEWHLAPCNGFPPAPSGSMTLAGKTNNWTLDDYRNLGKQQHIRRYEQIIQTCQSVFSAFT